MPPKGWRKYADGYKPVNSTGSPLKEREAFSIDDLLLPKSTIQRLAKEALPAEMTLPKDAVTALLRSSTVFINYLASEANVVAHNATRSTISAADVYRALENIELAGFVPSVKDELSKYEAMISLRKQKKSIEKDSKDAEENDNILTDDDEDDDEEITKSKDENETTTKKPRLQTDEDETEAERDSTKIDETVDEDEEDEEDITNEEEDEEPRRVISSVPDEKELAGDDIPDEVDQDDEDEEEKDEDAKAGHFDIK